MTRPTVSICIPTHEPDERHLALLLSSIEDQQYPNLEVVVSDDASSADVGGMFGADGERLGLRFRRNDVNAGMVGAWNLAVRASQGELAMLVHQDDVLVPGLVESYVSEFEEDNTVVLCSCAEIFIDADGRPAQRRESVNRRSHIYRHSRRYVLDHAELVRLCLRNGQAYGEPSAVMFRRSAFDTVGGYDAEFEHAADVDFNLRVARLGNAVYLATPLLQRRLHGGNLTRAHIADGAQSRDRVRLYGRHAPDVDLSAADTGRIRVALVSHATYDAARAVRLRRYDVARENLSTAWQYARNPPRLYWERLRELVSGVNLDER